MRYHFSLDISFGGMVTSTVKIFGENYVKGVVSMSICAHKKLHTFVNPIILGRAVSKQKSPQCDFNDSERLRKFHKNIERLYYKYNNTVMAILQIFFTSLYVDSL